MKANSLEHIIPAFLGGKKRVRILCYICNNFFGSNFEKNFYQTEEDRNFVLLKIVINFYVFKGLPIEEILDSINILRDKKFQKNIIKEVVSQEKGVKLYTENNILIGFVRLKEKGYVITLKENYTGKQINYSL